MDIITVQDVVESIKQCGIMAYANRVIRDTGGRYYFVDADMFDEDPDGILAEAAEKGYYNTADGYMVERVEIPDDTSFEVRFIRYRVTELPMKIGFFIVEAYRLKEMALDVLNIPQYVQIG